MTAVLRRRPVRLLAYVFGGMVGALLGVGILAVWPAGAATPGPYTDPASTGFITLYDTAGHAVKAGRITDKPFVGKAVSSQEAAVPYDGTGRKATLLAYQPMKGVPPLNWNGDTLTASTPYDDPAHPTASATAKDFTLQDFLSEYPLQWDGLVQLRIYLGVPGQPTLNTSYVSTDIQVTGQTWKVVGGGPGAGSGGANIPGSTALADAGASPSAGLSGTASASSTDASAAAGGANGDDALPTTEDLAYASTPRVLFVGAAAIVGIVLVGLLLRRVPVEERVRV